MSLQEPPPSRASEDDIDRRAMLQIPSVLLSDRQAVTPCVVTHSDDGRLITG